jgi:hypothetical protein
MGVLYDNFRAGDDGSAVKLIEDLGGGPVVTAAGSSTVDAVDLKGIDPRVTLARLVCLARGVEWNAEAVDERLVWSEDEEGPWVSSIGDDARDALASIAEEQMPRLSAAWGRTDELAWHGPLPGDAMLPVI